MLKIILFSVSIFSFYTPKTSAAVDCAEIIDFESNSGLHQQKLHNGVCDVTLSSKSLSYPRRSFDWNSEGRLMSFVDMGKTTGAHAYYIVPVESNLKVKGDMKQGSQYEVKASEQNWVMNKSSAQLTLPETCQGAIPPATNNNRGGLDIKSCQNKLVIDAGWKIGGSPDLDRTGQSIVHDPQGTTCAVNNKDIYKYQPGEEPSPKLVTSQDWFDFLKSQPSCQNLNITFLREQPHNQPDSQKYHPSSGAQ